MDAPPNHLPDTVQRMLIAGQVDDALGVFYLTGACTCSAYAARGWIITNVERGPVLHWCNACGRPSNKDSVLGIAPWLKGDVAVFAGQLCVVDGAPGPTGQVRLHIMGEPDATLTTHVALLNMED